MKFGEGFALLLFVTAVTCSEDGAIKVKVAGVSHLTITVSNLTASTHFYTKILGGMVANDLSSVEGTSDVEYVKLFTGEDGEWQTLPDCAGDQPDCTKTKVVSTKWKVYWVAVIFDNVMIQLVQYESLKPESEGDEREATPNKPVSPLADMMGTKIAFWVWDSVNLTEYANYLEQESHRLGLDKVKFTRPLLLSDNANFREANRGVRQLRDEELRGLSIGYAKGPDGESLKFIQLIESSKENFGKHYCRAKMVSSALLDTDGTGRCEYKQGIGSQLNGVNHISIVTADINRTMDFFINEMGGYFVDDIQPSRLQSPSLTKLLLSKLKVSGMNLEEGMAMDAEMVSKMHSFLSKIEINLRYILLGNLKIEVMFLSGLPKGMPGISSILPAAPEFPSFSKAGSTEIAFVFSSSEGLRQFAMDHGAQVEPVTIVNGPLTGLSYSVITAPNKQMIRLVHYSADSKHNLYNNLREYGSVHPVFAGMNPWGSGGYYEFCGKYAGDNDF